MRIKEYYRKSFQQLQGNWSRMIGLLLLGLLLSLLVSSLITAGASAESFLGYLLPFAASFLIGFVFLLGPTFGAVALVTGNTPTSKMVFSGFKRQLYPNVALINVFTDLTGRILNLVIGFCFAGVIPALKILQYVINLETLSAKVLADATAGRLTVAFLLLLAISFIGGGLSFMLNGYFTLWNMIQITHPQANFSANWRQFWAQMKHHHAELWRLQLSFIPLLILGILTIGLGFLWISPLDQVMLANFAQQHQLLAESKVERN